MYDEIFEKGVCDPDEVAVVELAKGYLNADPPMGTRYAIGERGQGQVRHHVDERDV